MRQLIVFALRRIKGLEVVEADDGVDAMRKLAGPQRYDILLTDINMPIMDGLKLVKRVRSDENLKESGDHHHHRGRARRPTTRARARASAYITKPSRGRRWWRRSRSSSRSLDARRGVDGFLSHLKVERNVSLDARRVPPAILRQLASTWAPAMSHGSNPDLGAFFLGRAKRGIAARSRCPRALRGSRPVPAPATRERPWHRSDHGQDGPRLNRPLPVVLSPSRSTRSWPRPTARIRAVCATPP